MTLIPTRCEKSRKLQEKLATLPAFPLNGPLRRKRDKVADALLAAAREENCVPEIDLMAGTLD